MVQNLGQSFNSGTGLVYAVFGYDCDHGVYTHALVTRIDARQYDANKNKE